MKLREGMKVKCEIHGVAIDNAVLTYQGGSWFICQDRWDGARCGNKKGFKYSWSIGDGSECSLSQNGAKNLIPIDLTNIRDIYVGCKITKAGCKYEVLGICGRAVFLSKEDYFSIAASCPYTIEELEKKGYTLVSEEPEDTIEITIKKNGKVIDEPLSVETAKRLGIVE